MERAGDPPGAAHRSRYAARRSSRRRSSCSTGSAWRATRVADVAEALGVSPALVFYHFGTKDDLVAEAFAHAVERDLHRLEKAAAAATTRSTGCAGCCGSTARPAARPGWRIWIDAWALAQREPRDPQGAAAARPAVERRRCASVVDDGVATGVFTCPDPAAAVARVSALLDGLSVAALVYRSVTRAQLRGWVAEAVARELGARRRSAALSSTVHRHTSQCGGVVGLGQRRPVQPERREVGRGRRPSSTRSASSRPNVGANLKPCAAPSPTTTRLVARAPARSRSRGPGSACTGSAPTAPARRCPGSMRRPGARRAAPAIAGSGSDGTRVGVDDRARRSPGRP